MDSRSVKVPEPRVLEGQRDSKVVENFIWDMEQYFEAAHAHENDRMGICTMYRARDAKLWWRMRVANTSRPKVISWETLKGELKDQFLPDNAAWVAREALQKLRQTGLMREYVNRFASLMLDI
ncbi:hypothetical protein AMTRI_Chr03g148910 [Amborella trichopoda]